MAAILIVEDSPTQAGHIQLVLEEAGFQTVTAEDGREALAAIRRAVPDIVVTDLEMPNMNGLQLVETIRREYPALPVVLMTAHGSEDIAALALRNGAASYVPKAYLEQDLVVTINRILELTRHDHFPHRAVECLVGSSYQFTLHNDASLIQPVVGFLEKLLIQMNLGDATERMRIGVALQEALLNAMHHGNLEVSSDLRQTDEQHYHEEIDTRRGRQPYMNRRVHVSVTVTREQATYRIRDEGPGFDPAKLPDPLDPANLERVGGRGLLLIRTFMDKVVHNDKGNEITLVKTRGKAA